MVSRDFTIQVSQDIEMRLAQLISVAGEYQSRIYIIAGEKRINAKSLMGMMSLVSSTGDTLSVTADGPDETAAVNAIIDFVNRR